jgi:hypothetical protein
MTTEELQSILRALAVIPPVEFYLSLRRDAIVAVMGTLVCEEARATEIFDRMEKDGIIRAELTPPGDPRGLVFRYPQRA